MTRPAPAASASEIVAFARDRVRFAAHHGPDEALRLLDRRDDHPAWSEALGRAMSRDHS